MIKIFILWCFWSYLLLITIVGCLLSVDDQETVRLLKSRAAKILFIFFNIVLAVGVAIILWMEW